MRVLAAFTTASVVLTAVAVTGCSSGSASTAASAGAGAGQTVTASSAAASAASPPATSPAGSGGSAGLDACSLLTAARATALVGQQYTGATAQTIATGQDQCTYPAADDGTALVVIVYQPDSGVTFDTMKAVQDGAGQVTSVSGVGDRAIAGSIELDVQSGDRLLAVQGAGGTLTGQTAKAAAVAKAIIAALG